MSPPLRVKLQVSHSMTPNMHVTRVLIRVLSKDVAEVRYDVVDGTCSMTLLSSPWQCYGPLAYLLDYLGLRPSWFLGTRQTFGTRGPGLIVTNLAPQSIDKVCDAGLAVGWPLVVDRSVCRWGWGNLLYFSDDDPDGGGVIVQIQHLRRLDPPSTQRMSKKGGWSLRRDDQVWAAEPMIVLDKRGLPTHIGPGFVCVPPPPPSPYPVPPPPPPPPPPPGRRRQPHA